MSLATEESNFLRFYFLNLKIASKAVRVYFDSVHPPAGLATELAKSSATLKKLWFITTPQQKILYPSPASNVRSDHFDTTLIVCLLRNLQPCETAPATGWDVLPRTGDKCKGADLARIKWYRNLLAHNSDGKLSLVDFGIYWGDVEGAIGRLGGPAMLTEAQSAQHITMDQSLIDMLKLLRQCEKDVQDLCLTQETHNSMITGLQSAIDNQRIIKEQHENKIQNLTDSLKKGEDDAQKFTTELKNHKGSIDKCKDEIAHFETDIEKNGETIRALQEQSVTKQNQMDTLTALMGKLEIKYENNDKMLRELDDHLAKHDVILTKQDEHFAKCDEHLENSVKCINDLKKKQHDIDVKSRKRDLFVKSNRY